MKDIGDVVVYGAPWCGDCIRSESLLDKLNIKYEKINIDEKPEVQDYIRNLQNGARRIPTILFQDGSFLVEPSDNELSKKIKKIENKN